MMLLKHYQSISPFLNLQYKSLLPWIQYLQLKMNQKHLDEIKTETTLTTTRKRFQRQSNNSSRSRQNSKKSLRDRTFSSDMSIPYIRMKLINIYPNTSSQKLNSAEKVGQKSQKQNNSDHFDFKKSEVDPCKPKQENLSKKIQDLLEQTLMRQQELNQMNVQKQDLLMEVELLKTQIKILNQRNSELRISQFNIKSTLNQMTKERNVLLTQKSNLVIKVIDLQKNLFPEKYYLGTLREQHLEKEILQLKKLINKKKSDSEMMLENQIIYFRQKLFNANKIIDNLKLNNICLYQKNQKISKQLRKTPELLGLRLKYQKTQLQKNQLRKSKQIMLREFQNLRLENVRLLNEMELLKQSPVVEQSLNYSVMSILSEK